LVGLSPDAEPALAKLGARAPCAVASLRRRLRAPDGLAGANLARTRSPEEAIAPLKAAARERLRRRAGLGPLAGKDALQAAGPGLGLTPAETGALVTPVTADADVVAAGSAAAKLARAGTAPPTGGGR